jgi:hypothetical protein
MVTVVDDIGDVTTRGSGGFGSTGRGTYGSWKRSFHLRHRRYPFNPSLRIFWFGTPIKYRNHIETFYKSYKHDR